MPFKKGDVVQLKSGGPKMTIEDQGSSGFGWICKWFVNEEVKTEYFDEEALRKVDEQQI